MKASIIALLLTIMPLFASRACAQTNKKGIELIPVTFGDTTIYKLEHSPFSDGTRTVSFFYSGKNPKFPSRHISIDEVEAAVAYFQRDGATQRLVALTKKHVLDGLTASQLRQIVNSDCPRLTFTINISEGGHITNFGIMLSETVADKYIDPKTIYSIMDDVVSSIVFSSYHRFFNPDMGDIYFSFGISPDEIKKESELRSRNERIPPLLRNNHL